MTVTVLSIIIAVLVLGAGLFILRAAPSLRTYFNFRGKRLVTCPETHKTTAVNVSASEVALGTFFNEPTLRLNQCSRWPERQDCGQECLQEIEADAENCLVWRIVAKWYEGKTCVFCHKPIGQLSHMDHAPALLGPDFKTAEWREISPEELPEVFAKYQPVCWNCHVAESFRRLHPELIVERPVGAKRAM